MKHHTTRTSTLTAALALIVLPCAIAQTPPQQLELVTVTARPAPEAGVAGWGDRPLADLPLSATVIGGEGLKRSGATRLADITAADAAISDAYNSVGYWDFLSVRGFVLDNRFNFRRDGLPINAETFIALDNKARIEVLKGTSGMQAGTSAPGGLVNYVVKRPLANPLSSAAIEWREQGSVTLTTDLSRRFGAGDVLGARLNAAIAELQSRTRRADGRRHVLAFAGDARLPGDALLEAEIETSRRSQPSVPGFSLLGAAVPAPPDPRININNQPWSLPVVLEGHTASLRYTLPLAAGWRAVAHAATQRLRSDDRVAFPFGCTDVSGTYYADRYCPDGSLDLYDFRSENERRRTDTIDVTVSGRIDALGLEHRPSVGVLHSRVENRFGRQAFNYAGAGRVNASVVTPAAPDLTAENTNRDERSTELHARNTTTFGAWTTWLGVRRTRIERAAVATDGSVPSPAYGQSFTSPFVALSHAITPGTRVYASAGRGVESEVVADQDRYLNRGQTFTLRSRQTEIGVKGTHDELEWSAARFDITRPLPVDLGACDVAASCTRAIDGNARHRGVDASIAWRAHAWTLRAGAQAMSARREASADAANNGLVPANVPRRTLRLHAEHRPSAQSTWYAVAVHEGPRYVTPDNAASIPGWTRVDAGASLTAGNTTWRVGIDNLFDKRAWQESPYQFGHAYLFPLAPRTARVSIEIAL